MIRKFLKDLFYGNMNAHADLARFLVALALLSQCGAAVWNAHLGAQIELGSFGTGLSLILGAGIAAIAAKDWAKTNAVSQAKQDDKPVVEPAAPASPVTVNVAPPPTAAPQKVEVVNPPSAPVPTVDAKAEEEGP